MGNTNATAGGQNTAQLENGTQGDYDIAPVIQFTESDLELIEARDSDEAYGKIRIYRVKGTARVENDENGQEIVMEDAQVCTVTKIFDSKEDCEEYYVDLEEKKALIHPNVVRLLKSKTVSSSNFCSNIFKVDMAFEFFNINLETEIIPRFQTKEYYDEPTIFEMLYQVLHGLYYLQTQGVTHGDIQPRTILIDQSYGSFKITDIRYLTQGICGYRKHLAGIESECFLAPELLSLLKTQTILDGKQIDQERADVFSLGLVGLAMSTLQNVNGIYNFDDYTIREDQIQDLLENVKKNYSHNLQLILASMLNHVDKRLDIVESLQVIDKMRNDQFSQEEYERLQQQEAQDQNDLNIDEQPTNNAYPQQENNNNNNIQRGNSINNNGRVNTNVDEYEQPKQNKPALSPMNGSSHTGVNPQGVAAIPLTFQPDERITPSPLVAPDFSHDQGKKKLLESTINNDKHQPQPQPQQPQSQSNVIEIENRVREALMRSQQVSMKFENSPLRMFRDQLLADELYVPLEPQYSQLSSGNHKQQRLLESSNRKNNLNATNSSHLGLQNSGAVNAAKSAIYSNNVSQSLKQYPSQAVKRVAVQSQSQLKSSSDKKWKF